MFDYTSAIVGGIVALAGFIFIMSVIVPDDPAKKAMTWLAERKNFPTMLMPVAVPALVLGLVGLGWTMWLALTKVSVPWWVWAATLVGVVGVGLFVWARRRP